MTTNKYWSGNPANQKQMYAQTSLIRLITEQCHKYCVPVDGPGMVAESSAEHQCIRNCQDKTYQTFDMHMDLSSRLHAKHDAKKDFDLSGYMDMEIEHGHDTENVMGLQHGDHHQTSGIRKFIRDNNQYQRKLQMESVLTNLGPQQPIFR